MKEKVTKPPYTSYRSFVSLIDELRGHDVLPGVIDRSYLSKRSGSEQSALISTMKWFGLISESGAPTDLLREYLKLSPEDSPQLFNKMVMDSYPDITDGIFSLDSATTAMLADQFRQSYDLGGNTLGKSISFFLAAAKEAGIKVSPHAKAPVIASNGSAKRKQKTIPLAPVAPPVPPDHPASGNRGPRPPRDNMIAIPIPIFGGSDGVIYLPANMTPKQWTNVIKMTEFILQNYQDTMAEVAASQTEEEDGL